MRRSDQEALVAWSAIAEPSDEAAGALVNALGAAEALEWAILGGRDLALAAGDLHGRCSRDVAEAAVRAHERWGRRLASADEPHERRAASVGARVLTRGEPGWPSALASLGFGEPFALYVRGGADLDAAWGPGVAVVGARSSTSYGSHMAADIASGVAAAGRAVLSGGAYGIDAAAHRAALAVGGVTIAVMAGGVDRLYPAGNDDLLRAVIDRGAVVSEVPPGFAPHRSRFLTRNRLIAAGSVTVVVEAALRSGALNTARHAAALMRPVGAVPGPATSPSSAGCHELIRDGAAVLVAGADHVLELAETATEWAARGVIAASTGNMAALVVDRGVAAEGGVGGRVVSGDGTLFDSGSDSGPRSGDGRAGARCLEASEQERPDFQVPGDRAVYDVISRRVVATDEVAKRAGIGLRDATSAAGRLEMQGLIERSGGGWRRSG